MGKDIDGLLILATAGYLIAVMLQGNFETFLGNAIQDYGYLEFLIAAIILYALAQNKTARPYVIWMVVFIVILVLIQHGQSASVVSAAKSYGAGDKGLFASIFAALGFSPPSNKQQGSQSDPQNRMFPGSSQGSGTPHTGSVPALPNPASLISA